jgi:hypothetical protein
LEKYPVEKKYELLNQLSFGHMWLLPALLHINQLYLLVIDGIIPIKSDKRKVVLSTCLKAIAVQNYKSSSWLFSYGHLPHFYCQYIHFLWLQNWFVLNKSWPKREREPYRLNNIQICFCSVSSSNLYPFQIASIFGNHLSFNGVTIFPRLV